MKDVTSETQSSGRKEILAARRRLLEDLPVTERTVKAGGVSTAVVEGGSGPPLVLLHGQGGSALAWMTVISDLVATHRLVIPDLPGLGESAIQDGEVSPDRITTWLDDLLTETCDEPPTVAGISLGGTIAAHLAIRRAKSCRQLVLVDSGSLGRFRPDPRVLPALIRLAVRPSEPNIERLFRHTLFDLEAFKTLMGNKWPDFIAYGLERASTPSVQTANRHMLQRLGTKQIPESELKGIGIPVALIWGRHDRVMKLSIAESARDRFGWPLRIIEDSGHVVNWDQPQAFSNALRAIASST